jgi:hypothetical protein
MLKKASVLWLFLFSGLAQASTVTIDFESAVIGDAEVLDQGYKISGDIFSGVFSGPDEVRIGVIDDAGDQLFEVYALDGTNGCACNAPTVIATIEREDGGAFAFYSADLTRDGSGLAYRGILEGGGFASDPTGTGDWLNVIAVEFRASGDFCTSFCFPSSATVLVDDIVVGAAVPIPAAVWLFGSALAGLGWLRRRPPV